MIFILLVCIFHLAILKITIATSSSSSLPKDYRQQFSQVWTVPMPSSTLHHHPPPPNPNHHQSKHNKHKPGTTIEPGLVPSNDSLSDDFIHREWQLTSNYMYGNTDVSFIPDPYVSINRSTVMRVMYGEGSYSPKGSTIDHRSGGTEFFSTPFGNQSFARALVQYDMAMDAGFDWVAGGKLPGIFGGRPSEGCSGGRQANGQNCFSIRLMWRESGFGEAYLYIPTNDILCRETPEVICNKHYGVSLFRGRTKFTKEQWTKIEIAIQINDPPFHSNGVLQVWQDNQLVMNMNGLQFRTTNAVAITSLMFSTFFGGGTPEYATPHDTFTYFKNIKFSVADPVELSAPVESLASFIFSSSINFLLLYSCIITFFLI